MRKTLILSAVLALGCAADSLIPARVPAVASVTLSSAIGDTSATVLGDSVIARATFTYGCSGAVMARAGREGGKLVVTITDSLEGAVPCAYLAQYRTYRAAAGPLPAGRYSVEVRFRDVVASSVSESTLLQTTVTIP